MSGTSSAAPHRRGITAAWRRASCRRGTAAIEFSLLFLALLTVVVGVIEVAWQSTVAAALDRATVRASRFGLTGQAIATGAPAGIACRSDSIAWLAVNATGSILRDDQIVVSLRAHQSPSTMGSGGTEGAGTGSQVATYDITYTQPFLTGAWLALMGAPAELIHRSVVVVKNEAFDNAIC